MSVTYRLRTIPPGSLSPSGSGVVLRVRSGVPGLKGDDGDSGPNLITDATSLGTLTDIADPAFLLVGAAAGDAARKLTPTPWGLSNLLATVPAGRVPYADGSGLVTSNAGLTYDPATGFLRAGRFQATSGNSAFIPGGTAILDFDGSDVRFRNTSAGFAITHWFPGAGGLVSTSAGQFGWTSTGNAFTGSNDTGLARDSLNTVRVTNGSTGVGNLVAGNLTVRQPLGTPGSNEVRLNHDGTFGTITNPNSTAGFFFNDASGRFAYFARNAIRNSVNSVISWTPNDGDTAPDVGLARLDANTIEVNNGTRTASGGALRGLSVSTLTASGSITAGNAAADTRSIFRSVNSLPFGVSMGSGAFYLGASAATTTPDLVISNNSGVERLRVTDGGVLTTGGSVRLTTYSSYVGVLDNERIEFPNTGILVHGRGTANPALRLRGPSGHTGNLLQCENNAGTAVASVSAGGGATFSGNVAIDRGGALGSLSLSSISCSGTLNTNHGNSLVSFDGVSQAIGGRMYFAANATTNVPRPGVGLGGTAAGVDTTLGFLGASSGGGVIINVSNNTLNPGLRVTFNHGSPILLLDTAGNLTASGNGTFSGLTTIPSGLGVGSSLTLFGLNGTGNSGWGQVAYFDANGLRFTTAANGAGIVRGMEFSPGGTLNLRMGVNTVGFYGVNPVARQTLPDAGTVTAADIRTALISLGLCQ